MASLSSRQMLRLSIAAMHGFRVDRHADAAEGLMGRNETGRPIEVVTLHPCVAFCGDRVPTRDEVVAMHREAHEECFIAHSVRSEVRDLGAAVSGRTRATGRRRAPRGAGPAPRRRQDRTCFVCGGPSRRPTRAP